MKDLKLIKTKLHTYFDIMSDRLYCRCGCKTFPLTVNVLRHYRMLGTFREWFNRPCIVNSGYRCKAHHKAIYKKLGLPAPKTSGHLDGIATDIKIPHDILAMDYDRRMLAYSNMLFKWAELCKLNNITGFGFKVYESEGFFHLDSKNRKSGAWVKLP